MVRFLLNHFPTWAVILGMMLACCVIGWMVYLFVNRYGAKYLVAQDPHYARESIHLAATLCAFILAFMIVLLWQSYQTLEDTQMNEARAIGRLEIFSESLPKANDLEISSALQAYVDTLIHDEWEAMQFGQVSSKATELLLVLRRAIEKVDTQDPVLANYRHQMLEDFNEVTFARYLRLEHRNSTIPNFFLVTIFINMLGMFVLLCLLKPVDNVRSHHFFLIVTSMLVGLNLSFLLILDYPFSGELSIASTPLTYIPF
jgi:glycerol uptake facilitator-like aquaporin